MIPILQKKQNSKSIRLLWLASLREQGPLCIIAMTALLAPLIPAPLSDIHWHGAQTVGVELGAVLLLVTILCRPFSSRNCLQTVLLRPLIFLNVLLLWCLFSFISAKGDAFAIQGLLLFASGVLVVHVIAHEARTERHCLLLTDALMVAGLLVAFSGLALYSSNGIPMVVGVLHDHMLFGAFIMLLIPISLAVSLAPVTPVRRLFAQVTLLSCIIALLMAQTRSSWIGTGIALLTFGGLLLSVRGVVPQHGYAHNERRKQYLHRYLISAMFILALGVFLLLSPEREAVLARAKTLTTTVTQGKDDSTQWRFNAWVGDRAMICQKPMMGWGVGSYPRYQYPFTHMGHSREDVIKQGPTILDEAHNSYLQFWVEIGLPGLMLWLAFLASVFCYCIPTIKRFAIGSLEQRLVIGSLSAIAGQMADAFANPAWQFGHIILPLWIVLGLIISLTRRQIDRTTQKELRSSLPATRYSQFRQIAQLIIALIVVITLLWLIAKTASILPAPYL